MNDEIAIKLEQINRNLDRIAHALETLTDCTEESRKGRRLQVDALTYPQ